MGKHHKFVMISEHPIKQTIVYNTCIFFFCNKKTFVNFKSTSRENQDRCQFLLSRVIHVKIKISL